VLAEEGVGVARRAERVLELGAAGEDLRELTRKSDRERGEAPRAPHQTGTAAPHQRDGVVVACGDLAVMDQIGVGDTPQSADLVPLLDDRLLGEVAACHHQRPAGGAQQQDVERRVGEHGAEVTLSDRDLRIDRARGEGIMLLHTRPASVVAPTVPGILSDAARPSSADLWPDTAVGRNLAPLQQHDGVLG